MLTERFTGRIGKFGRLVSIVKLGTSGQVLTSNGSALPSFQATSAVSQATQAAIEAETNEDTYIPPDLLRHNPGITKMWVKFQVDGTVDASFNVTSVTDNAAGDWTVNIATDFSSANYFADATAFDTSVNDRNGKIDTQAAGTLGIVCIAAGVKTDPDTAMFASASGDQ